MAEKKTTTKRTTRKRNTEVEPFEDEDEDELDLTDEEEDEDDEDENSEDEEDDEDDLDDFETGFAPFIIDEKQSWDLAEVVDGADAGEDIYFYRAPDEDARQPAKWYVLKAVKVGELPES